MLQGVSWRMQGRGGRMACWIGCWIEAGALVRTRRQPRKVGRAVVKIRNLAGVRNRGLKMVPSLVKILHNWLLRGIWSTCRKMVLEMRV